MTGRRPATRLAKREAQGNEGSDGSHDGNASSEPESGGEHQHEPSPRLSSSFTPPGSPPKGPHNNDGESPPPQRSPPNDRNDDEGEPIGGRCRQNNPQVSQGATISGATRARGSQQENFDANEQPQEEEAQRDTTQAPINPLIETIEQKLKAARKVAGGLAAIYASTKDAHTEFDEKTRQFLQEQEEMHSRTIDESQAIIEHLIGIEAAFEEDGRFQFEEPLVSAQQVKMFSSDGTTKMIRPPTTRAGRLTSEAAIAAAEFMAPTEPEGSSSDEEPRMNKGKSRALPVSQGASIEANPFERKRGESDADYKRRVALVHKRMDREESETTEQLKKQAEEAAEANRRAQSELEAHRREQQNVAPELSVAEAGSNGPLRPDPPRKRGEPEDGYQKWVRNFRRINGPPPTTPTSSPYHMVPTPRARDEVRFREFLNMRMNTWVRL